jgi:hypothetical protein
VSIGVTATNTNTLLPGYSLNSIGWHGDDGKLYKDCLLVGQLLSFSTGDTVGIGMTSELLVYFTLNGLVIYYTQLESIQDEIDNYSLVLG